MKVRRQNAFLFALGDQVDYNVTVFGGNHLVCTIVTQNLKKLLIMIISSQLDVLLILLHLLLLIAALLLF